MELGSVQDLYPAWNVKTRYRTPYDTQRWKLKITLMHPFVSITHLKGMHNDCCIFFIGLYFFPVEGPFTQYNATD